MARVIDRVESPSKQGKETVMSQRWVCISIGIAMMIVLALPCPGLAGERFTDNGDGTVTDHALGLMWATSDNHGDIDWHQADKWVRFTFPYTLPTMYGNWRLPTLAELQSLVAKGEGYESDCGLLVNIIPQIRLSCGWAWTSESGQLGPTAMVFNFNKVYHYSVRKAHRRGYRALPVRNLDGQ
jgi:hypothetical protein